MIRFSSKPSGSRQSHAERQKPPNCDTKKKRKDKSVLPVATVLLLYTRSWGGIWQSGWNTRAEKQGHYVALLLHCWARYYSLVFVPFVASLFRQVIGAWQCPWWRWMRAMVTIIITTLLISSLSFFPVVSLPSLASMMRDVHVSHSISLAFFFLYFCSILCYAIRHHQAPEQDKRLFSLLLVRQ